MNSANLPTRTNATTLEESYEMFKFIEKLPVQQTAIPVHGVRPSTPQVPLFSIGTSSYAITANTAMFTSYTKQSTEKQK